MSTKLFTFTFAALALSSLVACSAESGDPTTTTQDGLTGPTVCVHADEDSCLADPGCAWGDQGKGPECFYVGPVDALPEGELVPPPAPAPEPGDGTDEPSGPTVCSHHTSETACLADEGCAWGDQGKGPECFYVGSVEAY